MSIKSKITDTIHAVRDGAFQLGTHLLPKSRRNPHRVFRDPKHLEDVYRRVFTSGYAAGGSYQRMLMADPYFEKLFHGREGRFIVRVAVIAEELVANIYTLGYYRSTAVFDPYNDNWIKEGVANLFVHRALSDDSDGAEVTTMSMLIQRPLEVNADIDYYGDMKYDYFEPVESYSRLLTKDELRELAPTTRVNRPAMERYYEALDRLRAEEKARQTPTWKKA